MITTRESALSVGIVVICTISVVTSAYRHADARESHDAAQSRLEQVRDDANTILRLRQKQERIAWRQRPTDDVIAQVNAALAEAGLPGRHLAGVRNESDAALGDRATDAPAVRQQSISINLSEMSIADLGRFLSAWRATQTVWTTTRLSITHPRSGTGRGDSQFDINLVISALYIGDGAE